RAGFLATGIFLHTEAFWRTTDVFEFTFIEPTAEDLTDGALEEYCAARYARLREVMDMLLRLGFTARATMTGVVFAFPDGEDVDPFEIRPRLAELGLGYGDVNLLRGRQWRELRAAERELADRIFYDMNIEDLCEAGQDEGQCRCEAYRVLDRLAQL